jgi:hypothetical protein
VSETHLDDEQLSAVVDGLADADEAEHVASCHDCQARLQRWQRVLGQLASVPEPAPDAIHREDAISAALAESVSGIEGAKKRRRLSRAPAAGVAAALLVVGGLAFGLSQIGGGSNQASTSSGAARSPSSSGVAAPNAGASSNVTATGLENLGTFGTASSLQAALRQPRPAASSARSPGALQTTSGCPTKTAADASVRAGTSPAFQAAVTYQGQASTVTVFATSSGHVAVVETNSGCALQAKLSYP